MHTYLFILSAYQMYFTATLETISIPHIQIHTSMQLYKTPSTVPKTKPEHRLHTSSSKQFIKHNMAIPKALILGILGCVCFCSSVLAARELNDDLSMVARHESWMVQYGRVYKDDAEKAQRFGVFKANVGFIESFNAEHHKFYLGINQFIDLTNEEFKGTKANKGYKPSLQRVPTRFRHENLSLDALPATVDWRTKGAVTSIKDQGQCGKYF